MERYIHRRIQKHYLPTCNIEFDYVSNATLLAPLVYITHR